MSQSCVAAVQAVLRLQAYRLRREATRKLATRPQRILRSAGGRECCLETFGSVCSNEETGLPRKLLECSEGVIRSEEEVTKAVFPPLSCVGLREMRRKCCHTEEGRSPMLRFQKVLQTTAFVRACCRLTQTSTAYKMPIQHDITILPRRTLHAFATRASKQRPTSPGDIGMTYSFHPHPARRISARSPSVFLHTCSESPHSSSNDTIQGLHGGRCDEC